MVIGFSNDRAWNHLVVHGFVVTFRPRRENRNCETWVNRGRGEEKEFDCRITELGKVEFHDDKELLKKLDNISGFESWQTWEHAIESLHGELPDQGFLYLVRKLN